MTLQIVDDDLTWDDLRSGETKPGIVVYESDKELDPFWNPLLFAVKKRNIISGDLLTNAFPTLDKGSPVVSFEFNNKGGRKFGKITTENIGKKVVKKKPLTSKKKW